LNRRRELRESGAVQNGVMANGVHVRQHLETILTPAAVAVAASPDSANTAAAAPIPAVRKGLSRQESKVINNYCIVLLHILLTSKPT